MKFKDLKIGTKLYGGFIAVLVLTIIVGAIAYSGISKIVYQIEISELVNRIIVDAGDAQASSLRFIIYGDDKYYDIVNEEAENIKNAAEYVKTLLLSNENKQVATEIHEAISSYVESNNDFHSLEKKKLEVHKIRASAALDAINEIVGAIEAATTFSKAHKGDYSAVERIFMLQEARNAMNRVRIVANIYVANPTVENEEILFNEIRIIEKTLENAYTQMVSNDTKDAIKKAQAAVDNYTTQFKKYKDLVNQQNALQVNTKEDAEKLLKLSRDLRGGVNDFIDNTEKSSYTLLVAFTIFAILLGFIIGAFVTRMITIPLNKGLEFANSIARGDLTKTLDIDQKDEVGKLGRALSEMSDRLKEVVTNIILGADNIATASEQMSSTSQQLSQGANEQAASVEEISSTMEEIAANISQNTDNSQQTEKISVEANKSIKDVAQKSNEAVIANKNISNKIQIINDIAFQTNILALNAAVEAARAGEHGKGFAVVAAEVRKLAERSKIAADEIVNLAKTSLETSENAGKVMEETIPQIENTTKLIQEISAASVEQNNGAGQVNNAIQQLNNVTQQNASSSEEMASGAEELSSQADQLKDLMSFFTIGEIFNRGKISVSGKSVFKEHAKPANAKSTDKGVSIDLEDSHVKDDDFSSF